MSIVEEKIRTIINTNERNIAFVIGNGINIYFFPEDAIQWKDLIKYLYLNFIDKKYVDIPDITLTELFDLIELQTYHNNNDILKNLTENHSSGFQSNPTAQKIMMQFMQNPIAPSSDNNLLSCSPETTEFIKYNSVQKSFMKNCKLWCENNIDDCADLTDTECLHIFMETASNRSKLSILKNQIKKAVVNKTSIHKTNQHLTTLIRKIQEIGAPILTTNYDTLMSDSANLSFHKMGEKITAFYPWNAYYSNQCLSSPTSGFGIWHINGMNKYSQSIKLGLSDYMGNVERARKMIHAKDFNEFFTGKNQLNWIGSYTWLNIIFNKHLFIFGLGLEQTEIFLRWLLVQRAKYSYLYNQDLKGWYIDINVNPGKKFFLEKIGIDVIEIKKYDELYKFFL